MYYLHCRRYGVVDGPYASPELAEAALEEAINDPDYEDDIETDYKLRLNIIFRLEDDSPPPTQVTSEIQPFRFSEQEFDLRGNFIPSWARCSVE